MNAKRFSSIIMDMIELRESDLLVTFFTKEKGKLKGIAKGAKRSKKRFFNCLDLFCFVDMELENKKNKDLWFLHSCKLIEPFNKIRENYTSYVLASYMIELIDILFPIGVTDELMFKTIVKSLNMLHNKYNCELVLINFEAKIMSIGGYRINLERCQNCGRPYQGKGKGVFVAYKGGIVCLKCFRHKYDSVLLEPEAIQNLRFLQSPYSSINTMKIKKSILSQIKEVLKLHIEFTLGNKLRSKRFIDSLFPLSPIS